MSSKVRPAPAAPAGIWLAVNRLDEDRRPVVLTTAEKAENFAERDYWTVVGPYAPDPSAGQKGEPA